MAETGAVTVKGLVYTLPLATFSLCPMYFNNNNSDIKTITNSKAKSLILFQIHDSLAGSHQQLFLFIFP